MADKRTEKTPKGLDVPIPKRGEFIANLKKVATAESRPKSTEQSGMRGKGNRRPPGAHSSGSGRAK